MKRRWHGIPIVALGLILLTLVAVSGGVVTAVSNYSVWSGTALVEIKEPLVVGNITAIDGDYNSATGVWELSGYAGEPWWLTMVVTNLASVTIPADLTASFSSDCGGDLFTGWFYSTTPGWTSISPAPEGFNLDPESSVTLGLAINSTTGCDPCTTSIEFDIER